ncbi:hypothetical protein E2C01_079626 [Portunus trituberculatus]|uniref:Uncharacterized protein n=1 Tax=Portunus trituberculatus TaxID=210409 RepID=A0A5B7IQT8_PORTR|nr:hypothetical protein [Portunus trituberculatus]
MVRLGRGGDLASCVVSSLFSPHQPSCDAFLSRSGRTAAGGICPHAVEAAAAAEPH